MATGVLYIIVYNYFFLSSGNRALPDVYKDITEMQVDISQYKNWSSKEKSLPNSTKPAAHILKNKCTMFMNSYISKQPHVYITCTCT